MTTEGSDAYDALVIGSGPNGLTAALALAAAGWRVHLREAAASPGGGCRTTEMTLPGYSHDRCAAVLPLAVASPALRDLPLHRQGLVWIEPPLAVAHPLDGGQAAALGRGFAASDESLGRDAVAWRRLFGLLLDDWTALIADALGPLKWPRHPLQLARFGLPGLVPAASLAGRTFQDAPARALFAGLAAHAIRPLDKPLTSAVALLLGLVGHAVGWPFPRGGAQRLTDAMVAELRARGGTVATSAPVHALAEVVGAPLVLADIAPRNLARLAGDRLPGWYRRQLGRYRHGPGVFKVDWALDSPVPWQASACALAGTVHLGGTLAEVAAAEAAVARGAHPSHPFVLVTQPSLFDATRAPAGRHTLWAYCHVPAGSTVDMTARIEAQIERFAPGFGQRILARQVTTPADLERYNANYVGGDIACGLQDLRQLFTRPVPSVRPYRTPNPNLYLCSAATPPGPGVHGLCGHWAARTALADRQRSRSR